MRLKIFTVFGFLLSSGLCAAAEGFDPRCFFHLILPPRVLVVEATAENGQRISDLFIEAGFQSSTLVLTGIPHWESLERPDIVVILDRVAPRLDIAPVIASIKANAKMKGVGVVLYSRFDSETEQVAAFQLGVDRFVESKKSGSLLTANLIALVRSLNLPTAPNEPVISHRGITIDLGTRTAKAGNTRLSLTTEEFQILNHLIRRPGIALSRTTLLPLVTPRDADYEPLPRAVDERIASLRKKLNAAGLPGDTLLNAVPQIGYRLQE